jgi:hypothetical protein
MITIFICGILGFLVFDGYRVYRTREQYGVTALNVGGKIGWGVHAFIYLCAGILAVFVNIDVLSSCCSSNLLPALSHDLVGTVLRGFGVGIAGPAGLSKWTPVPASTTVVPQADFGDMSVPASTSRAIRTAFDALLMR